LLVPAEAVIRTGQRTVVIAMPDDGKFAPVESRRRWRPSQVEFRKGFGRSQKGSSFRPVPGQTPKRGLSATTLRMSDIPFGARQAGQAQPAPTASPARMGRSQGRERKTRTIVLLSHGPIPSIQVRKR
jgi:hypothetical protein